MRRLVLYLIRWRLIPIIIMVFANTLVYAQDTKLDRDDFVSASVEAIFDKVGQYTSGEKSFLYKGDQPGDEEAGYTTDALGRKIPEPVLKPLNRPPAYKK